VETGGVGGDSCPPVSSGHEVLKGTETPVVNV
jgi:hypothetical protein